MGQAIKRGLIQSFDPSTYTASVLLLEATSTLLLGVPVSTTFDGSSTLLQSWCAVLFFDEHNLQDAVVIACYPNGSIGIPTPPPTRANWVTGYLQINGTLITNGTTTAFTLTGGSTGIPSNPQAKAVAYKVFFTSPTANAFIQLAPHGASIGNYAAVGNLPAANATINDSGVLPLDANGQIDIKAGGGDCTVTLYTYGYFI